MIFEISIPFSFVATIASILLGITIPVFIFAITLLGNAIERAKAEENKTKEQERKDIDIQIADIENKVEKVKKTGDSSELEAQLFKLRKTREKFIQQVRNIQKKYSYLRLNESVIYPGSFFVLAILLNALAAGLYSKNYIEFSVPILLWVLSLVSIGVGVFRLWKCLVLVQDVSSTSADFQSKKMTEAFKTALTLHEESRTEEITINFPSMDFPFKCQTGATLSVDFRLKLSKGRIARNAYIWFFIPDDFELISPSENWRQKPYSNPPNIRTVQIDIGNLGPGSYTPRTLKIKAPEVAGEFIVMYRIYAEGYSGKQENLKFLVGRE